MAGHQISESGDESLTPIIDDPLAPDLLSRLAEAAFNQTPDAGMGYSLAKRGVIRLVQREAAAWGAVGARICSLSPGIIDTPMGQLELQNQPMMATMIEMTPLGRQGTADEIASVVEFLLSDGGFLHDRLRPLGGRRSRAGHSGHAVGSGIRRLSNLEAHDPATIDADRLSGDPSPRI